MSYDQYERDQLLAEIERLRAELETERRMHGDAMALVADEHAAGYARGRDEMRAEIERLRAEATDALLVADGVKHDWRCRENAAAGNPDGPLCLRCQRDLALAALREARGVISEARTELHCLGRRPETAHEMSVLDDGRDAIDRALAQIGEGK